MGSTEPGWNCEVRRKNGCAAPHLVPALSTLVLTDEFASKEHCQFSPVLRSDVACESAPQVLRFPKLAFDLVTFRLDEPQDQRLQLFQVLVPDGEINAKTIPGLPMTVVEVCF